MIDTPHLKQDHAGLASMLSFINFHKPFLHILLGSLITLSLITITTIHHPPISPAIPYLFTFLLVYPLAAGLFIAKSPSLQIISLELRLPIIQQAFLLSWLGFVQIPLLHLLTGSDFYTFMAGSSLFAVALGLGLLRYFWRLQQALIEEGLFP